MFPRKLRTPQSKRTEKHSHRIEEPKIGYSTSIEKKRVPKSKIPKPTDQKSAQIYFLDQWESNVKDGTQFGDQTHKIRGNNNRAENSGLG